MNNNIKKPAIFIFTLVGSGLLGIKQALAVCPVCTVAVSAGIGLSRWLGIDDAISGLWIGGLTVSIIFWNLDWFNKKNINFRGRDIITIIAYYLLIVAPLYFTGLIGNPLNTLCACELLDKLLLGIIVGSFGFWSVSGWYIYLKEKNQGRAHFPFQKIIMPIGLLILLSIIFYFIIQ